MSMQPYFTPIDIGRGLITGASAVSSYGEVTTAGAASGVLWPGGTYAFPAAAGVQMALVSTSANDTSAGTGLRTVVIHYLDADLAEQVEVVTLSGLTPVNTVATDIRFIQCMHLGSAGSGAVAAGDITASNGGQTYSEIVTGALRCSSSVRMVPAGKRIMVSGFTVGSTDGNTAAQVKVRLASPQIYTYDFTTSSIFVPRACIAIEDVSVPVTFACPEKFTEGQSVGLVYATDKASTICGSWFGWQEDV